LLPLVELFVLSKFELFISVKSPLLAPPIYY
jgi:hypothetical protein